MLKKIGFIVVVIGIVFSIGATAQTSSVFATYNSGVYTFEHEKVLTSKIETLNECKVIDLTFDTNFDNKQDNYLIATCEKGEQTFAVAYPIIHEEKRNGEIEIRFLYGQKKGIEERYMHSYTTKMDANCTFRKSGNKIIGCDCSEDTGDNNCNHSIKQIVKSDVPW